MIGSFIAHSFAKVDYSQTPVDELIEILKEGADVSKYHVVDELGQRGERAKEAVPVLIKALKSNDSEFQYRVALALKSIDAINSHDILSELVGTAVGRLRDQNWREREMAAKFLGEFGAEEAIQNVKELLKDPYDRVKLSAGRAVIKIVNIQRPIEGEDGTSVKKEVQVALAELLVSNDRWVQAESAILLIDGQLDKDNEHALGVLRSSLVSNERDFRVSLLFSMLVNKSVYSIERTSDILEDIKKSGDAAEQHLASSLLKLLKE